MTDLRVALREKFRDIVDEQFNKDPEDLSMVRTPIGKFADAAADMIGALPSPPRYYPEEPQPVFTSALTRDEIEDGAKFDSVSVHYSKDSERVMVVMSIGADGQTWSANLAPEIAEVFFHQGLAVVRHAREQAGN